MAKVSKRELVSRVERMESAQSRFETEYQNEIRGMRRDMEQLTTGFARMETKVDAMALQHRDDQLAHGNKWSDTIRTGTAIITAVGLIIGGILWIVKATTAQQDLHQVTESKPQIVYVQPSPSASAPVPIQIPAPK